MKNYIKWILVALVIVLTACYISRNYYQIMLIQGSSMEPAYHNMQFVLLEKNFEKSSLQAGNVIAFHCEGLDTVLVKRIVASPGQTAVIESGTLKVDGKNIPFYGEGIFEYAGMLEEPIRLNEDEYIVIGDNISESKDSRYETVGIVAAQDIFGRIIQ